MSDLPPGFSDVPPGSSGPPGSGGPYGSPLPPPGPGPAAIKDRVRGPAIFLLIVNGLNLLAGVYLLTQAFAVKSDSAAVEAEVAKGWEQYTPEQKDQLQKMGWTPQSVVAFVGNFFLWGGGLSVIVGVLGVLGGMRMLSLRSYGLGITGSILTAIPCVTPCCVLGQVAGIWALVVLLQKDVRSMFQ